MAWYFKGTVLYFEKFNWGLLVWDEQFTKIFNWISLKKLLFAYTENTLIGYIST
jgi:hypothetical protein